MRIFWWSGLVSGILLIVYLSLYFLVQYVDIKPKPLSDLVNLLVYSPLDLLQIPTRYYPVVRYISSTDVGSINYLYWGCGKTISYNWNDGIRPALQMRFFSGLDAVMTFKDFGGKFYVYEYKPSRGLYSIKKSQLDQIEAEPYSIHPGDALCVAWTNTIEPSQYLVIKILIFDRAI